MIVKRKKIFLVSFSVLLLVLAVGLGFRLATVTHAQTPTPPACNTSNPTSLRVQNGLLATVDSSTIANFFINNTTPTPYCLTGSPAAIPQFALQSYDDLKSLYFSQATKVTPQPTLPPNPTIPPIPTTSPVANAAYLYNVSGDLTLNGNSTLTTPIPAGAAVMIFVDGNLTINQNLTDTSTSGLVLIVKGNVNIASTVDTVNAFIVTYGNFCDTASCPTTSNTKLTVNGSVIAINPPSPTPSPTSPQFLRKYNTAAASAEQLNYQAKYLVIFQKLLAKDLYIWSELQ